jgi:hypothetical protein
VGIVVVDVQRATPANAELVVAPTLRIDPPGSDQLPLAQNAYMLDNSLSNPKNHRL